MKQYMTHYYKTDHLPKISKKKLVTDTKALISPRAIICGTLFFERATHWQVVAKKHSLTSKRLLMFNFK